MRPENLARIDLNLLVVLHSLLRTRSVTKTAAALGISQPAASRALSNLRVVFEDRLLVRGAGAMVPTLRAEELAQPVSALLSQMEALVAAPTFDPASTDRLFRIATTDYGALAVLPAFMERVAREAPRAVVEIVPFSREVFNSLGNGHVDVLLYSDAPVPGSFRARELFSETFVSLVRRDHPLLNDGGGSEVTLEAFASWPHILVSVFGGLTGPVDQALAECGLKRRIALWVPYFATAAFVSATTDLIVTLPRRIADGVAQQAGLAPLQTPEFVSGYSYRLLWHERSHTDPGAAWLRRLVVESTRAT